MYSLHDYEFVLPDKLIAQEAIKPRNHAKMLFCTIDKQQNMTYQDKHFYDLPDVIGSDAVFFFNNTKVIKARIPLTNALITRNYLPDSHKRKQRTLDKGEIFIYKVHSFDEWLIEVLVSDGKNFKPWTTIRLDETYSFESLTFKEHGILMKLQGGTLQSFLNEYAQMPLPPYITYEQKKEIDYQTIFATTPGSVAAPTASLHFDQQLLDSLKKSWHQQEHLTLHVSLGTFKPVDVDDIQAYQIHAESATIHQSLFTKIADYKNKKKNIVAVWSTATRTLESLTYVWPFIKTQYLFDKKTHAYREAIYQQRNKQNKKDIITHLHYGEDGNIFFDTSLYISPGYKPLTINSLVTNFHLPGTSLLIMVASLMGYSNQKMAYKHAIANEYRFYSFGDWMVIKLT